MKKKYVKHEGKKYIKVEGEDIESFERVEGITEIILLGKKGGIRRIILTWNTNAVFVKKKQSIKKMEFITAKNV